MARAGAGQRRGPGAPGGWRWRRWDAQPERERTQRPAGLCARPEVRVRRAGQGQGAPGGTGAIYEFPPFVCGQLDRAALGLMS